MSEYVLVKCMYAARMYVYLYVRMSCLCVCGIVNAEDDQDNDGKKKRKESRKKINEKKKCGVEVLVTVQAGYDQIRRVPVSVG